jgi:hypothetical protein
MLEQTATPWVCDGARSLPASLSETRSRDTTHKIIPIGRGTSTRCS